MTVGPRQMAPESTVDRQPERARGAAPAREPDVGQGADEGRLPGQPQLRPERRAISVVWTFGDGGTSTSADTMYHFTEVGQARARSTVAERERPRRARQRADPKCSATARRSAARHDDAGHHRGRELRPRRRRASPTTTPTPTTSAWPTDRRRAWTSSRRHHARLRDLLDHGGRVARVHDRGADGGRVHASTPLRRERARLRRVPDARRQRGRERRARCDRHRRLAVVAPDPGRRRRAGRRASTSCASSSTRRRTARAGCSA